MHTHTALVALVACLAVTINAAPAPHQSEQPWMNLKLTPAQRAAALLAEMNSTEKFAMLHGYSGECSG